MDKHIQERFERFSRSAPTWDPVSGGNRPLVCWDDDLNVELGADPSGSRFDSIADRMIHGDYYPADAVQFFGMFRDESRALTSGDRVLQRAAIGPFPLWSMAQIFVATRTPNCCHIGYITTTRHFGRGIWQASLTRENGLIKLHVWSTAGPGSVLFWLGLPVARYLQLRARRRAIEEFRKLN